MQGIALLQTKGFCAQHSSQGPTWESSNEKRVWKIDQFNVSFDIRLGGHQAALLLPGSDTLWFLSHRAVDILRTASATSHMRLLIARDDDAR